MSATVTINFGEGSIQGGFTSINVRLVRDARLLANIRCALPAAAELQQLYYRWQSIYHYLPSTRGRRDDFEFEEGSVTNVSVQEFKDICNNLKIEINRWLN